MKIECDVLIVGAGPSGVVASLVCSKGGMDTVLIEKNSTIGGYTKTKLDATLGGGLSNIITELKLKIENEIYKSRWYPPSEDFFILKSDTPEYYFKRGSDIDSFEVITAGQAEEAGSRILLNTRIKEIKDVGGRVDSLIGYCGEEELLIEPKVIVAADGGNSIFHKFVNKRSENRKKIGYGVSGNNFSDSNASNIYFNSELIPGGYFYLITGESGLSSACIGLDSAHMSKPAKYYYENFLSREKHLAEKIKSPSNKFYGEGLIFDLDKHAHENIVFVGDAAGLLDPFFGYGMASAIVSSYHAGKIIITAIEEDINLLRNYDSLINEKFDKRLSYLYQRVFESLKNDDLDLIAEILKNQDKKVELDTLLKMLSG